MEDNPRNWLKQNINPKDLRYIKIPVAVNSCLPHVECAYAIEMVVHEYRWDGFRGWYLYKIKKY